MVAMFDEYGRYYDLLYRDKDYTGEAEYIAEVLRRFRPGVHRLLELGCGTGRHASLLADRGYDVTGVERSSTMLAKARSRCFESREIGKFRIFQGDTRTVRLEAPVDAVVALFHVASYHTSNADLLAFLETGQVHLPPGGLFVFDVWYGPAVLSEGCQIRIRRIADNHFNVLRIAEPLLITDSNCVAVNYSIQVKQLSTGETREFEEQHVMRYLFDPEIDILAEIKGFRRVHSEEWMTGRTPSASTWGVLHVLEKVGGGQPACVGVNS